jgi:hypothetical protein
MAIGCRRRSHLPFEFRYFFVPLLSLYSKTVAIVNKVCIPRTRNRCNS